MVFPSPFILYGAPMPDPLDSNCTLMPGCNVYLEDVGVAAPGKSGGGSSSSTIGLESNPPAAEAKKGKGAAQGGLPPRCQVEGCGADLSHAKAYYPRHKVCATHSKSPKVVVAGVEKRFCQQCSRFHLLLEFDLGKRSCRRRLADHNMRRRKPLPHSIFPLHRGRFSPLISATCTPLDGGGGGIVLDFTQPKLSRSDLWQNGGSSEWLYGKNGGCPWQKTEDSTIQASVSSPSGAGYLGVDIPSGGCYAGAGASVSGRALSLLSSQPWAEAPRKGVSGLEVNECIVDDGLAHGQLPSSSAIDPFQVGRLEFGGGALQGLEPGHSAGALGALSVGFLF